MALRLALKEWSIVCEAVSQGSQIVLARKGGISEPEGEFQLPKDRFWLYPTFFHEAAAKLNPLGTKLLTQHPEFQSPPATTEVRLSLVCEVVASVYVEDESKLAALASEQILSREALAMRFHYRQPGIHALVVCAYTAADPAVITPTAAMSGCKSWVDLGEDLEPGELRPVLEADKFESRKKMLLSLLTP